MLLEHLALVAKAKLKRKFLAGYHPQGSTNSRRKHSLPIYLSWNFYWEEHFRITTHLKAIKVFSVNIDQVISSLHSPLALLQLIGTSPKPFRDFISMKPHFCHCHQGYVSRLMGLNTIRLSDCCPTNYLHNFKAAAWGSSFQPAKTRSWEIPPSGTFRGYGLSQHVGVINNESGCLDYHKGSRDNHELRQGCMIRFIHRRSFFQE